MDAVVQSDRAIRSVAFRKEREGGWHELEGLVELVGKKGIKELTAEQAARLPHLYRATLSALSVARSISLDRALTDYLESLCGRAYFCVYGTREPARNKAIEYLAWGLPSAVRKVKWQLLVSFVMMMMGAATAFYMVQSDPENYYMFVPAAYAEGRDPAATNEELRAVLYDQQDFSGTLSHFAAFLFSHNATIGILAFALGFAVMPTALLVFMNGLILGAFAALYDSRGMSVDLWGWLLPHGVTELSAVAVCGAAGLAIGQAWIFPGEKVRIDNLRERGAIAGRVVLGGVIMFFIAALIEGIFRQTVTSIGVRYTVAVATLLGWTYYFVRVGRAPRVEAEP